MYMYITIIKLLCLNGCFHPYYFNFFELKTASSVLDKRLFRRNVEQGALSEEMDFDKCRLRIAGVLGGFFGGCAGPHVLSLWKRHVFGVVDARVSASGVGPCSLLYW